MIILPNSHLTVESTLDKGSSKCMYLVYILLHLGGRHSVMSVSVVPIVVDSNLPLQHLIFLLILCLSSSQYGEGGKCSDTVVTLRGPHGVIQTPNFPHKFDTPINCQWIIDSTEVGLALAPSQRKSINVYLTQMNLKDNLKFIEYNNYSSHWPTASIEHKPDLLKTRIFRTKHRYLGIELKLSSPYQSHLRTRDYFLNEYGFNITYEILPETVPQRNDTCSFSVCSFAGKCYVSHDYQRFYCHCLEGHFGSNCQNNHKNCDPQRNISFCARGTCRNMGSWSSICYCPEGYSGPKCENQIRPVIKECPGPDCETLCSTVVKRTRPCSCHNGRIIPKGWVRYEGKLKLADVWLSQWDSRSTSKPSEPKELNILSRIERTLKEQLQKSNSSVGDVSIISVGTASEFVFQFFGDRSAYNSSFTALTHLKSTGQIGDGLRLGGSFNFDIQPSLSLKGVSLNKLKIIRTSEDFSITCEAVGSARIQLRWFKDEIPINSSLATRYIYEDHVPRNSQDRSVSMLILYQVSIYDRGTFTCQASDMGEEQCASTFVDVLLPPVIEVEPMSLTLLRNDSAIITCFANNDSGNYSCSYTWYRDDEKIELSKAVVEVVEDLDYPRGSLLRIIQAESSAKYTCVVENFAGRSRRDVFVAVLDSQLSASCRSELDNTDSSNTSWKWTAVKHTSLAKCPSGYTGFAQRTCQLIGSKPRWSRSDFSRCVSVQLKTINNTLQKLKMGFAVQNSAEDLVELLAVHLQTKTFLFSGEGENMIHVLNDAAKYALDKQRVKEVFPIFFEAVTRLLTFPESCVHHRSLITLINLVQLMAARYSKTSTPSVPSEFKSSVMIVETMRIDIHGQYNQLPYNFPRKNSKYPDWLELRVQFPLDTAGISYHNNQFASLLFIVFRNITDMLSPAPKVFNVKGKSVELISSIVTLMFPSGYNFRQKSHIHLEFDISPELLKQSSLNKINLTCGALDNIPDSFRWKTDVCNFKGIVNSTIHCQCDTFGQYALLSIRIGDSDKESSMSKFHWSVSMGSIVCITGCAAALLFMSIHLQFRFRTNSIYLLKMIVCLTLIISVLLIMSMRAESSSIGLSTSLCSLLIVSLCCQLTKSLYVLLLTQLELFPWLRSVSLVTLLSAVGFGCILPVWTAAAAFSHHQNTEPEFRHVPVLSESSPVFCTFIGTVSIIVLAFLIFYYKAVLHLRSIRLNENSEKNYVVDYRLKTLNRALLITLNILVTILATILYGNITSGVVYQYFFGLSTFSLGVIVFFSYTVKSEYPIPIVAVKFLYPRRVILPDPENLPQTDASPKRVICVNRSPEKRLVNGQASAGLLEVQVPAQDAPISAADGVGSGATLDTFVGSSLSTSLVVSSRQGSVRRTLSALNMKRPSFTSTINNIPRSMTNPVNITGVNSNSIGMTRPNKGLQHPCSTCCKKNKSFRSHSASISSGGKGSNISEKFKPERGRCLLSEVTQCDYVMPSISTAKLPGKATAGITPSTDLFTSYVEPSPQFLDSVKERGITQFLTFHQHQFEADDRKIHGNILHARPLHFTDPKLTAERFTNGIEVDSVTVQLDEQYVSETDGSQSSFNLNDPVITFHRGESIPGETIGEKTSALNVKSSEGPTVTVAVEHVTNNSSYSGGGSSNGLLRRPTLNDTEETQDKPNDHSPNLNKSDLLVKKISHDLDILLDRSTQNKGKEYADVKL